MTHRLVVVVVAQLLEKTGKLPNCIVACVGGGSNAIGTKYLLYWYKSTNTDAEAAAAGLFHPFIGDTSVKIFGVEAGGENQSHPHFR